MDIIFWDYESFDLEINVGHYGPVIFMLFHIRVYLHETSRNVQEPHDLYFMVC